MSISLKTHKLLWGRSGNRCAIPECRHELIADETETDDESVIGDEAHIVARNTDGPRGESTLTEEERDKYDNLVLLCRIHHKIIDDQVGFYTVDKLKSIKSAHEGWVKQGLKPEKDSDKDDLIYAGLIDSIFQQFSIDNWQGWTSFLLSHGQPSIRYNMLKQLELIPNHIVSRFWPGRYKELEAAIFNMKNVLNDLIEVFYLHADEDRLDKKATLDNNIEIRTRKFYNIREWNPERYNELLKKYEYHVDLVEDLTLELTRAANLAIERARKYISPKFREEEGKLLITTGPHMDFSWRTFKVEYDTEAKSSAHPYNGLKTFMVDRVKRDRHMGEGFDQSYFPLDFFSS